MQLTFGKRDSLSFSFRELSVDLKVDTFCLILKLRMVSVGTREATTDPDPGNIFLLSFLKRNIRRVGL